MGLDNLKIIWPITDNLEEYRSHKRTPMEKVTFIPIGMVINAFDEPTDPKTL